MTLNQKHNELICQKMKLDKFFSMFLEKYERKMDPDNTDTPIWKLYKTKLKEYDNINREIKATKYWIAKESNVQYC
jgi:hypothetical protein